MAEWHINQIENELNSIGWKVIAKEDGDGYKISGVWDISRNSSRNIDFEGLNDMDVLSIEKSYSCSIRDTSVNLYFHKKGHTWNAALKGFIDKLNELD